MDREADSVTWYFDGKVIKTLINSSELPNVPINVPIYVIVDLAAGGWISFRAILVEHFRVTSRHLSLGCAASDESWAFCDRLP
jgi:hypothetical protein